MTHLLSKDVWEKRALFRKLTRNFFEERGYLEVETPHLLRYPSLEPHLDPYAVELEKKKRGFLNTSPEVNLKKLLGSCQLPKIFELAHSYRGGEKGEWHRSEFIMLEWYARDCQMFEMMGEVSEFLTSLFPDIPQHRLTVNEWFQQHLGIVPVREEMTRVLVENGVEGVESMDFGECFFRLFLPTESRLESMGVVFLSEYPTELSSYSKVKGDLAQRFEVYIHGIEVGNAYEERTDKKEMLSQLEKEQEERISMGKDPLVVDESFASALDHIEESVSGMAMGWDRLFAIWQGASDLKGNCPYPNWTEDLD